MDLFKALIETLDRLLGPGGCSWDREQTMQTLRHTLLEETCEVIEAIDLDDNQHMKEELGDLLFNGVFLCKLAEKENRFTLKDVLENLVAKLIYRHPHVFGEGNPLTSEEVLKQWETLKQIEKKEERKSALDGIPKDLPALARAQKVAKKIGNKAFVSEFKTQGSSPEDLAGEALWKMVEELSQQKIQAEEALRKRLTQIESEFREWESANLKS